LFILGSLLGLSNLSIKDIVASSIVFVLSKCSNADLSVVFNSYHTYSSCVSKSVISVPLESAKAFNPLCLSGCHYAIPNAFPLSPLALVFKLLSYKRFPTIPAAVCSESPLFIKNYLAYCFLSDLSTVILGSSDFYSGEDVVLLFILADDISGLLLIFISLLILFLTIGVPDSVTPTAQSEISIGSSNKGCDNSTFGVSTFSYVVKLLSKKLYYKSAIIHHPFLLDFQHIQQDAHSILLIL